MFLDDIVNPMGIEEAKTDYQKRRQRERDVDAGKPVNRTPRSPQTDYAKKRAKEKRDLELFGEAVANEDNWHGSTDAWHAGDNAWSSENHEMVENSDSNPVAGAIVRRIMMQRLDLLKQYGPELVGAAIDNVADYVGDVDEIGSSDVSGWVAQVERMLKDNPPEAFSEGQVSPDVSHRGDVDTTANIEVPGVNLKNDTFKITYNGKPYQVKIQNFSQEGLGRWQIADYDVDIINSKGKKVMIDWDKDRQVTMVNTIIAYLDTQQASDIQLMAWRQVGIENSTAEDLYQEIQDFYQNDQQKIDKATAWLAQNIEDTDQRQVFADYVKNPVSRPARTKYIPKEYLMYVAFSYSREGNTELTPGMNLKPIQLDDPDDEEELQRKVDELIKKIQFKFDAFENKIVELADSYGLGSDPDLGSGFGQREMVWDHKTMTTSSSESNLNRQQILAKSILNFQAEVKKYVASFNNTLIKIGLPGIGEYSTWSGVLGDQLTDQQVRYFDTPEGFANLATGKIDLAKMLDDNVDKQGVAEGWSDAMVSRRTGQPRTPYSVYIKGQKWKDFENDDHARAVMDKLKAKFKADGRDPETITIAPTDMSEGVADVADQVKKVFKDKSGKPVGEIGIDPESSPGNGEWYVHHYATGYSVVGFDSAAEAKRELMYVHKHPDAVDGHPSTKEQGVAEAIVASGPSRPLDDRAVRKLVWDTMKINADSGEQAIQRALSVLSKKPQSRMVQDLQDKFQGLADRLAQSVAEEKTRLDPKCWSGKKIGNPKTKVKGGVRVNNCVPAESVEESYWTRLQNERNTQLNTLVNELKESIEKK
jgi:hypothetical protein